MKYDVIVIGSGPGGIEAVKTLLKVGRKILLIEKDELGGVCLNKGCIPTKALIASARFLSKIKESNGMGIGVSGVECKYENVARRQEKIVVDLRVGLEKSLKSSNVEIVKGKGKIVKSGVVEVTKADGKIGLYNSNDIILATGSIPVPPQGFSIDDSVMDSDMVVGLKSLPESILIIGSGAIGCEYASLFNHFGCKVYLVEMLERILPAVDSSISKRLESAFKSRGVDLFTGTKVLGVKKKGGKLECSLSEGENISVAKVLVAVGRKADTDTAGCKELGLEFVNGFVKVDEAMKTSVEHVYAVGDIVGGKLYAHVASMEGFVAASNILGSPNRMDYNAVPACIFTDPEIGSVGLTEEEAIRKGRKLRTSQVPYRAVGVSKVLGEENGVFKLVVDKVTEKIIGIHILGADASGLIAEGTVVVKKGIGLKEFVDVIHAHPTLAELYHEAASRL